MSFLCIRDETEFTVSQETTSIRADRRWIKFDPASVSVVETFSKMVDR
ncbi:hypothetical protein C7S16_1836 [Burkholderia thailandensis]|uniref:Uncharacterized protein n=1 Tax=Burkholderia thailandensis TaxID=57975 RepID=A0AAW9CW33_BURTH|nr:hypothetical protein [Burkholderia thailandensis]MDW9254789.1 hypothetical protein [Burkholderia thailandensis]